MYEEKKKQQQWKGRSRHQKRRRKSNTKKKNSNKTSDLILRTWTLLLLFFFSFSIAHSFEPEMRKNTRNIKSLESLYTFSFFFAPIHCSVLFRPFCMCVSMSELKISASEFNRLYVPCLFLFSSDFTSFILFISLVFFPLSLSLSPFLSIERRKVFFQTKYAQKNGNFDSVTFVFCYLFLILGKLFFSTHTHTHIQYTLAFSITQSKIQALTLRYWNRNEQSHREQTITAYFYFYIIFYTLKAKN